MARCSCGRFFNHALRFTVETKLNFTMSIKSSSSNLRWYSSRHVLRRRAQLADKDNEENSPIPCTDVSSMPELHALKQIKKLAPIREDLENNEKRFQRIIGSLQNRKNREKTGKILLEGKRLIETAAKCGCVPEQVFYSKESMIPDLSACDSMDIDLIKVTPTIFRMLSGNLDPPSVVAVADKPVHSSLGEPALPVTILCSNVRNPENMGSIISIAATTGCKAVLLTKGCVDPWERKVLKAGEAAQFVVPIINNIEWFDISNYISKTSSVYIADSSADIEIGESQIFSDIDYQQNHKVIPNNDEVNLFAHADKSLNEAKLLCIDDSQELPCMLFSSVAFPKKDIIVYIGGETEGIDPRATELLRDYQGMSLKIPLENDMDSLNVCSALSIIIYEIKRQLQGKSKAKC